MQITPTVQVLHVEKRGLQFHEVLVEVSRDAGFRISSDDRRLFEYRFQQIETTGAVPLPLLERALALVEFGQTRNVRTAWPKPLRAWNADGWYFHAEGSPLLSFSTETDTRPPQEIVEFFQQVEALAPKGSMLSTPTKDVCLGFCYDPAASLGALYTNQRCRRNGNGYRCF